MDKPSREADPSVSDSAHEQVNPSPSADNSSLQPATTVRPPSSKTWGGRRPGAGAPRGNTNALKTGRYSPRLAAYLRALASDPDMQYVIGALGRIAVSGGDTRALMKNALRGVTFQARRDDARARLQRVRRARARDVEALVRAVPPAVWRTPPPLLQRDSDGNPLVFVRDNDGAPYNPLTGRYEPVDPTVPRTIILAHRRVQRALRRRYVDDLLRWAAEEFKKPFAIRGEPRT